MSVYRKKEHERNQRVANQIKLAKKQERRNRPKGTPNEDALNLVVLTAPRPAEINALDELDELNEMQNDETQPATAEINELNEVEKGEHCGEQNEQNRNR